MKTYSVLIALFTTVVLLSACKKEEPQSQPIANVLTNGDFEATPYQDWTTNLGKTSTTKPNTYSVSYSTEAASSPSHSIKVICSAAPDDTTYQFMQQVLYMGTTPIPAGAKLTMKVKIKTVNVQGNGISLALGGNLGASANYAPAFYTSTEGKTSIVGTQEFTEYSLTFDSFPANMYSMYVLLFFLPKTTGTAYYDDVSLRVN
ncbi:hypothetical protein [Spirosoma agri]|uniref:Uncharacterized protein n=1 Tax=Spirosoma agri TaxID=1987381 RepID=A0A6M0IJX3_9BACT|nr:hypothetical protein [Spirosoma agri]NEU67915.1 hypothetical protein [Spirosoma agri]